MFTNCYKLRFRRVTAIESPFQCFLHIKMPGRCSAPRCTNSNKEGFCLTTFTQDPKLRQEWIDAAGIPDWNPPKSAVLCEVHFRPSALYCVGNKKFIKKNIIPSFFCKCDGSIKRKPLAEIQSKELQCNELVESLPHKKVFSRNNFPSKFEQENKSSEEGQCVNEFKEHNYFSVRKNTECTTFQSYKKRRTERYVHTSDCIIKKKPITVDTLKKALSEKENSRSDSDAVEDINTSPEIIRNEILSTESSPSLEDSTLKKALSDKENSRSDSDAVEDINTSPEIIRNEILSTESSPSVEDSTLKKACLRKKILDQILMQSKRHKIHHQKLFEIKYCQRRVYLVQRILNCYKKN
ncbi:uncharacterized protein [Temnothorax longispinosus]|uniref:uncharacterized protein n=1 Tax=Temnothorax longispinosus TaxID=300112 RepID=UPI003A99F541